MGECAVGSQSAPIARWRIRAPELKVECLKCVGVVAISKAEALRRYDGNSLWKLVASDCSAMAANAGPGVMSKTAAGRTSGSGAGGSLHLMGS